MAQVVQPRNCRDISQRPDLCEGGGGSIGMPSPNSVLTRCPAPSIDPQPGVRMKHGIEGEHSPCLRLIAFIDPRLPAIYDALLSRQFDVVHAHEPYHRS